MLKFPVRQSLATQVAALIHERVGAGTYGFTLPSERNLAAELKVSRTTIRAALATLSAAGTLPPGQAKKLRKLNDHSSHPEPARQFRIRFLANKPLTQLPTDELLLFTEYKERCEQCGWECLYHHVGDFPPARFRSFLRTLVAEHSSDLWICFSLHWKFPNWFHDRKLPVLAVNSVNPAIQCGVISHDVQMAQLHAVNVLLRAGRKQVVVPRVATHEAFPDALRQLFKERGLTFREDFHHPAFDGSRGAFLRLLDQLFVCSPRPDGLVLLHTKDMQAITLQGWLMQHRLCYPQDLSVIQVGSDAFLNMIHPPIAHYIDSNRPLVRALFAATQRYFITGALLKERKMLLMQLSRGASI